MKTMIIIAAAAMLAGCATAPQQQYGYGAPADPSQWRVVSVTPVPPGTGARVAANSPDGSRIEYSSEPVTVTSPVYVPQNVYAPAPIYAPQPSYYYPPVSLSLGFVFGRHWSSGRHHRGFHGRRHR
jgi:hypothetical protein